VVLCGLNKAATSQPDENHLSDTHAPKELPTSGAFCVLLIGNYRA